MNSATKKEKDSSILRSSLVGNASDNGTNLLVLYHHCLVSVDYSTVHRVANNMSICQNLSNAVLGCRHKKFSQEAKQRSE